jgi:hypothetical protein
VPDININFHATPKELVEWVQRWASPEDIHLVAMRFPPISFESVTQDGVITSLADPAVRRLSFLIRPFDGPVGSQGDFDDKYSDQLVLEIGRLSPNGLGESWLACRTANPEALQRWKRIVKDLKSETEAGVTTISRQTGNASFYKSHLYSGGAKALETEGVTILPLQGQSGPELKLGNLTEETTTE